MELLEKDEEYISSLLKQGKKVEAIAFIKNKTGMSLIEAKDYIDKKNISISEEDEKEYVKKNSCGSMLFWICSKYYKTSNGSTV